MLKNYYCLKGIVSQDLEDHVKYTRTHHNLIVRTNQIDYQVNIDTQSDTVPNVKVYYIEQPANQLLVSLNTLGNEGLFNLQQLSNDYRLDYLRSGILSREAFQSVQPMSWQDISALLDQHITIDSKVCILGEMYDDEQNNEGYYRKLPHGLQLRQKYNYLPPRGIHDIHMNQGTPLSMPQSVSNGIYQDGAIFVETNDNIKAFFFVFAEDSLATDDSGNPM